MTIKEFKKYCRNNESACDIFIKAKKYLDTYNNPACFVSGGADSDVMMDIIYCADDDKKVRYVYFDTGLEMEATKRQIKNLKEKYSVDIETVKPEEPIPVAVKKYGYPIFNKLTSEYIDRLQKHGFDFTDEPFTELHERYSRCDGALKWWCNDHNRDDRFNINNIKYLKDYMLENKPDVKISPDCCLSTKKNPSKKYCRENNVDLKIIGVRKDEGGARSTAFKSCFTECNKQGIAEFRPLWWMTNKDRTDYVNIVGIQHSDAYTVYGFHRTGCAGCPFGRYMQKELETLRMFEPKLYKACMNVFGASYDYMDGFYRYRDEKKKLNT